MIHTAVFQHAFKQMPVFDLHTLITRIAADAVDREIDDASFRRRTQRAVRQAQRAIEQPFCSAKIREKTRGQPKASAVRRPAYRFIAVPNGAGGTTSVSMSNSAFEELAQAFGSDAQVNALARKVAVGHKPESGISRSAYVVKRLRQRAARANS